MFGHWHFVVHEILIHKLRVKRNTGKAGTETSKEICRVKVLNDRLP